MATGGGKPAADLMQEISNKAVSLPAALS